MRYGAGKLQECPTPDATRQGEWLHTLQTNKSRVHEAVEDVVAMYCGFPNSHGICFRDDRHDWDHFPELVHVADIHVPQTMRGETENAQIDARVFHLPRMHTCRIRSSPGSDRLQHWLSCGNQATHRRHVDSTLPILLNIQPLHIALLNEVLEVMSHIRGLQIMYN